DGHMDIVKLLLDRGANLKAKWWPVVLVSWAGMGGGDVCRSPGSVREAAGGGHRDVVELLLDRGADLEAKDIVGQTTLLLRGGGALRVWHLEPASAPVWCAGVGDDGHCGTVELLLDRGADLEEATGCDGIQTVVRLREVVVQRTEQQEAATARLLVHRGADVDAKDDVSYSAAEWATIQGSLPAGE
ncbi:unnamed protein product, partial [Symbiodinium sp. KB8]